MMRDWISNVNDIASEDVDNLSSAWMDVFEGSVQWTQNASREIVLPLDNNNCWRLASNPSQAQSHSGY